MGRLQTALLLILVCLPAFVPPCGGNEHKPSQESRKPSALKFWGNVGMQIHILKFVTQQREPRWLRCCTPSREVDLPGKCDGFYLLCIFIWLDKRSTCWITALQNSFRKKNQILNPSENTLGMKCGYLCKERAQVWFLNSHCVSQGKEGLRVIMKYWQSTVYTLTLSYPIYHTYCEVCWALGQGKRRSKKKGAGIKPLKW